MDTGNLRVGPEIAQPGNAPIQTAPDGATTPARASTPHASPGPVLPEAAAAAWVVTSWTIDLVGCARCEGDGHTGITFRQFVHPVEHAGDQLTHWAPCPTNGDPILMRIVPDAGGES